MSHDLESRRRAIARAFRAAARADDVTVLNRRVDALSRQVDELARVVEALRRPARLQPAPEPTPVPKAVPRPIPKAMPVHTAVPPVHIPAAPVQEVAADEEPPGGRVTVPPITPARISNQAFDVLLGSVSDREPADRIA